MTEAETVEFLGGPFDGRITAIPVDPAYAPYLIPVLPFVNLYTDDPTASDELPTFKIARYDVMTKDGYPSRKDDGTVIYQFTGWQ